MRNFKRVQDFKHSGSYLKGNANLAMPRSGEPRLQGHRHFCRSEDAESKGQSPGRVAGAPVPGGKTIHSESVKNRVRGEKGEGKGSLRGQPVGEKKRGRRSFCWIFFSPLFLSPKGFPSVPCENILIKKLQTADINN